MRVTNLLSSAVKCVQLPHIGSHSRARHILSVPVLFLTGNEPCLHMMPISKAHQTAGIVKTSILAFVTIHSAK